MEECVPSSWYPTSLANACILETFRFFVVIEEVWFQPLSCSPSAGPAFVLGLALADEDDDGPAANPAWASTAYNLAFSARSSSSSLSLNELVEAEAEAEAEARAVSSAF